MSSVAKTAYFGIVWAHFGIVLDTFGVIGDKGVNTFTLKNVVFRSKFKFLNGFDGFFDVFFGVGG